MSDAQGSPPPADLPQHRATYLGLIGLFLGTLAAFSAREQAEGRVFKLKALDLATLGLATYRTGRVIPFDQVTEPLRAPVTKPSGGGTEPKGSGVQRAFGELVSCPTCIGTWIAAGSVYGLPVAPRPTHAFLAFMATGGIAELLDYATQALDKAGRPPRPGRSSCPRTAGNRSALQNPGRGSARPSLARAGWTRIRSFRSTGHPGHLPPQLVPVGP